MPHPIFLYFVVYISSCVLVTSFVQKNYAVNTCTRTHKSYEKLLASNLLGSLLANPPVCTTNNSNLVFNLFGEVPIKQLKKSTLFRKKRQTLSWRKPDGMPFGTVIAFCNNDDCCNAKKKKNSRGNTYNICRECIHIVTLPRGYLPRTHYHITCQDTDYYETCLTGEGSCTTNTISKNVTYLNQVKTFVFGSSCSCEIRKDSIFKDFI
ncbi:uncharacterized protein LOC101241253 [Hydra vulgaris]|uniref:uncharacterized protein LOC101241253 n=1 Tax=Hydra vulgaris TaxID=6087 RepID=UPI001F5EF54F|nr:uncharacterized protein LOC101241253 [Hydra vulgaris]XP_047123968.1 uncharacterized protein LOC101241253 [Hydra vulgaris]XP_047123969.1 uncharacterized protein LOC101241253 [Hydra vulgaris]